MGRSWRPSFQWLEKWPGQCLICRRWQAGSLCTRCLSLWRPRVARCQRCAIDLPALADDTGDTARICAMCEDHSPEFDRTICAVHYTAPWSPLLARLKFNDDTALARPLGTLLAQAVAPRLDDVNLIVPIPLSKQRLIERGYNQSWLLARHVSSALKVEARHDLLTRHMHTSRLMAMSAQERQQHIAGAFDVTPLGQYVLPGRDVAVVDDVMTTGATLNAAASALLDAGANSVSAWVVARTPSPGRQSKSA
jgi:ComF family protein